METFFILLFSTILTVFVSLLGGFFLIFSLETEFKKTHSEKSFKFAKLLKKITTPLAALLLVYTVFFDLLPESLEDSELSLAAVVTLTLIGLVACFSANFVTSNFHKHGDKTELHNKTQAYSKLVVDSLHTIVDGIVIGTAFAAGLPTGLLAALSTAAHEIPQEIGDFSIMVRSKMSSKKILKLQIASGLLLVPSAVIAFFVGDSLLKNLPVFLALIAGFFLYIAIGEIYAMIKESRR